MNASANLLVLPSKFTVAVLAPKVVPKGSRGVPRRLQGVLWEALGLPWDRLGPTWDLFRIVLRSFWNHSGFLLGFFGDIFWDLLGIIWESLFPIFQNSLLELKLQLYGPP